MPYSVADIRARQFLLRMLLVAPPKQGKSTCAISTCPKPCFVLNTDGKGAFDYAVLAGKVQEGEMDVEDLTSVKGFKRGLAHVRANPDKYKTVVLDNLTFFAGIVEEEVRRETKGEDGRQVYPKIERILLTCLNDLISLPHHVIVIGHVDPSEEKKAAGSFGHILSISGKAKIKVPSLMQDWVWLEVSIDEDTGLAKYEFLLAPEGHWKQAVRSIKTDTKRMAADVSKFIRLASKRAAPKAAKEANSKESQ
jgi:hypothetical protein